MLKIISSYKFRSAVVLCTMASILISCGGEKLKPFVSFYYWKSTYQLDSTELKVLQENKLQQLYVRYFDIVYDEATQSAIPLAPITFEKKDIVNPIVPVVFIKNKVFEQLDSAAIYKLVDNSVNLLNKINKSVSIKCRALQIDCDWTTATAPKYFYFLQQLREKLDAHEDGGTFASLAMLSATIRLHQVKYPEKAGMPPVDKGVLMFYNMGEINNSALNSIYDQKTSQQYLTKLSAYKLRLDIALPIFAWGIHIRDGQVIALLQKMDSRDFQLKQEFVPIATNRYKAVSAFFKKGFYFQEGDEVKVEEIGEMAFGPMVADLKKYYPNQFQQVIFYDLDSVNISRYGKDFFQKTVAAF
jgi:hypothetical protein